MERVKTKQIPTDNVEIVPETDPLELKTPDVPIMKERLCKLDIEILPRAVIVEIEPRKAWKPAMKLIPPTKLNPPVKPSLPIKPNSQSKDSNGYWKVVRKSAPNSKSTVNTPEMPNRPIQIVNVPEKPKPSVKLIKPKNSNEMAKFWRVCKLGKNVGSVHENQGKEEVIKVDSEKQPKIHQWSPNILVIESSAGNSNSNEKIAIVSDGRPIKAVQLLPTKIPKQAGVMAPKKILNKLPEKHVQVKATFSKPESQVRRITYIKDNVSYPQVKMIPPSRPQNAQQTKLNPFNKRMNPKVIRIPNPNQPTFQQIRSVPRRIIVNGNSFEESNSLEERYQSQLTRNLRLKSRIEELKIENQAIRAANEKFKSMLFENDTRREQTAGPSHFKYYQHKE